MAIKIRCQDCKKKISIDEAFAGGMCRCPYCKALVYVEDAAGGAGGKAAVRARPTAPSQRPAAPGQAPSAQAQAQAAAEAAATSDVEHVPMARPVMIQGIITIVLLVLLVLMVGGGIAMAIYYLPGKGKVEPPPSTQPVTIESIREGTAAVVDIKITPPVIYVLDGGSGMRSTLDSARVMVIKSVGSLGEGKFSVVFAGEGQDKVVSPEFAVGGKAAATEIGPILQEMIPSGAADLDTAIKAALDRKSKTVVLFTRKAVNDAAGLAAKAKAQGAVIHTIVLDGDQEAKESLKKLAENTGGQTRAFSGGAM